MKLSQPACFLVASSKCLQALLPETGRGENLTLYNLHLQQGQRGGEVWKEEGEGTWWVNTALHQGPTLASYSLLTSFSCTSLSPHPTHQCSFASV